MIENYIYIFKKKKLNDRIRVPNKSMSLNSTGHNGLCGCDTWWYIFNFLLLSMGGATLFLGGSNEPLDFHTHKKKKKIAYKKIFFC